MCGAKGVLAGSVELLRLPSPQSLNAHITTILRCSSVVDTTPLVLCDLAALTTYSAASCTSPVAVADNA
jgi:hypothetical protein